MSWMGRANEELSQVNVLQSWHMTELEPTSSVWADSWKSMQSDKPCNASLRSLLVTLYSSNFLLLDNTWAGASARRWYTLMQAFMKLYDFPRDVFALQSKVPSQCMEIEQITLTHFLTLVLCGSIWIPQFKGGWGSPNGLFGQVKMITQMHNRSAAWDTDRAAVQGLCVWEISVSVA